MKLTPRTAYSQSLESEEDLLVSLSMNFDPFTINTLKSEFEQRENSMSLEDFVSTIRRHIKHWRPEMPDRDNQLIKILCILFKEIDINCNGYLEWEEFTNFLMEKAVASSMNKQDDSIKSYSFSNVNLPNIPVERLVSMPNTDRFAVIEEHSSHLQCLSIDTGQTVGKKIHIEKLSKQQAYVQNALYLSDLKALFTSCNDGTIRAYEFNNLQFYSANNELGYSVLETEHTQRTLGWDGINHVLYSADHTGMINLWNLYKKRPITRFNVHKDIVTDLIPLPKQEFLVSASQDRNIILWDTISGRPRRTFRGHSKGVLSLSFNEEYRLLFSAGFDHDIFVWNPYIDSVASKIDGHRVSIVKVQSLPNSSQFISMDLDNNVKVWDIRNFKSMQSIQLEEKKTGSRLGASDFIYIDSRKRLVFGGKKLLFLDYNVNYNPYIMDDHPVVASHYSETHYRIYSATTNKVKVWNAFTGKPEKVYAKSAKDRISCVTLDEWKKRMIIGDIQGNIKVLNAKTGALMKTLMRHEGEITCLVSSKDAKLIVSAGSDLVIKFHEDVELGSSRVLAKYSDISNVITSMVHFSSRRFLVTGNIDGLIQTWYLENSHPDATELQCNSEIVSIHKIEDLCVIISSDSSGEISFWGIDSSPFKYLKIFSWKLNSASSMVLFEKLLYLSDEEGFVHAYSIENLVKYISEQTLNANRSISVISRHRLEESTNFVQHIYTKRIHYDSIKHLEFIVNPPTLISSGVDKKVRLVNATNGKIIGSLHQGSKRRWKFYIDIQQLAKEADEEAKRLKSKLDLESDSMENCHVYKGIARDFIKPFQPYPKKGNKIYDINYLPDSPRTLFIKENIKNKAQPKRRNFTYQDPHLRKMKNSTMLKSIDSLPSLSNIHDFQFKNKSSDLKVKLNKLAFKSASKLAKLKLLQ